LLPRVLRTRIEHRPNLLKILGNSGWLLGDRILRLFLGVVVGAWVARHLGAAQFGSMSYALAVVTIFSALGSLGINNFVVRDLVRKPATANVILGTAFVMQVGGGIVAWVGACFAINLLRPQDQELRMMIIVLGSTTVFRASDVVRYWFESQVQSRRIVIVENAVMLLMGGYRIWLIHIDAALLSFVWANVIEAAITSVLILVTYSRLVGALRKWIPNKTQAGNLLLESWPIIMVSIASMINMRMDQLILGKYASDVVVGNYAAAVRVAEVWLMIPAILGPSIYPAIIAAKEKSELLYRQRIVLIIKWTAIFAIPSALAITSLSGFVISLLYGDGYKLAGTYLSLLIWSGVPYITTFAVSQMLYLEGLVRYTFYLSIIAVISNVSLNFWLIPSYGGMGAAISMIVTTYFTSIISMAIIQAKTKLFNFKLSK
jgi:O-antigen/teichoic acid export membrane protein